MIKVVGTAIIQNDDGDFLAIRLNKEKQGGVIVPPGGKLEEDETLRECVIREVKEELGVDIELSSLAAVSEEYYDDGAWVFVYYNANIVAGQPKIQEPHKAIETIWVDKSQFKNSANVYWL